MAGRNTELRNTELVVVLNDGETFSGVKGAKIVPVPDSGSDDEIVRYLKHGSYKFLPLGEVSNIETILDFFRLFFPKMEVEEDMDGNVLIDTGIQVSQNEDGWIRDRRSCGANNGLPVYNEFYLDRERIWWHRTNNSDGTRPSEKHCVPGAVVPRQIRAAAR